MKTNQPKSTRQSSGVKHGGARKNAGRNLKYGEPTKMISGFYCPLSKIDKLKELIRTTLKSYEQKDFDY